MFYNITSTKVNNNGDLADVVLDEIGIRTLASDTFNSLNLAGNTLNLGVKKLNEKLGGQGGTRGETILFGAPSGHGKSVLLLNTAYNIKRCNPFVETLDKTKKPLVVYFSAENTPRISYIRFAKLVLNLTRKELKALDPDKVAMMIDAKLNGENSGNIKIEFVYRKSNSFSVQDLRSLILERENDGYEVISVCLDYLKLLKNRKSNGQQETRHILSDISRIINEKEIEANEIPFTAKELAKVIELIDNGTISSAIAKKVIEELFENPENPEDIIKEKGWIQISDEGAIKEVVLKILDNNPQSIIDYKAGKDRALGFLVGQAMKETKGKANPQMLNEMFLEELKK
jgi:hypothetical protein